MKNWIGILFVTVFIGVLLFILSGNPKIDKSQNLVVSENHSVGDGDKFVLTASRIIKEISGQKVDMYAYNNSIPGPIISVKQNSKIKLEFRNNLPEETLLHSHGIRMDNAFDGSPLVQDPVKPGEVFTYELKFPDAGVYWYHPHIREDRQQEMGLYGLFIVEPEDSDYWPKVDREIPLVLDDIYLTTTGLNFAEEVNRVLMGRFGNVFLVNGGEHTEFQARQGEIIRFYVLNAANVRPFRISIPGAKVKLIGGDSGLYEKEEFVDELIISPSERYVIDVLIEDDRSLSIVHRGAGEAVGIANINVENGNNYSGIFSSLRENAEVENEMANIISKERAINKNINISVDLLMMMGGNSMGGMPCHRMPDGSFMGDCDDENDGIEWEDSMAMMNSHTDKNNVLWKIIDGETKLENDDIVWNFKVGDKVKVKIFNDPESDHPMHHPIHFHGQRFLILSTDGVANTNMVWKDTVLVPTGKTIEILLDITNPGEWMAHCHIAEHLEGGMMFKYTVI